MGTLSCCCAQVIPKLESPFFEEASQGKWPEAALFAFTFQPVRANQLLYCNDCGNESCISDL